MTLASFVDVILPLPLKTLFTYKIPASLKNSVQTGKRVIVQFGSKKLYSALVHHTHNIKPVGYEIKELLSVIDDEPIVNSIQIEFWEWMSEYYMSSIGEVYRAALPSGLKLESETKLIFNKSFSDFELLTDKEGLVCQILEKENNITIQKLSSILKVKNTLAVINSLLKKEAVFIEEKIKESYKPIFESYIVLSEKINSESELNDVIDNLKNAQKQQKILLSYLSLAGIDCQNPKLILKKELLTKANASDSILKSLIKKDVFRLIAKEKSRLINNDTTTSDSNDLNIHQQKALDEIQTLFQDKNVVLLHGITSSGKTEIYVKLIQETIKAGKQVLYLLPEIALTSQIIHRLKAVFGNKVGVYHSKFNNSERVEIWNSILQNSENSYQIILGVRSSIFLPFSNLGLIIVDEEHENTYKQFNPAPRYNARDASVILAHFHKAKVLMGTATPAIESYFNAKTEKYGFVSLNKRHKDVLLPEIKIANTRDAYKKKLMQSHFTPELMEKMELALANNEQIILFQNRRGFSPFLECEQCSWIPTCKFCDVSLTYHKNTNSLICHYCGYAIPNTGTCIVCKHPALSTRGFGTEKIEDEIKLLFPEAKVARMDMDTTRSKTGYEKILTKFGNREIDILIGTQMISKGLDFKHVSLVGILNADNMLNFPDFRAYERSFQLMTQVSGRAGRSEKQGQVIIQTSNSNHSVIKMVEENNYIQLYNTQINERKEFLYPPFCRIVRLTIKHKNFEVAENASNYITKNLRYNLKAIILGPQTPIVGRIQSYYLKNIIIKLRFNQALKISKSQIQMVLDKALQLPEYKSVQISIDVDPQ